MKKFTRYQQAELTHLLRHHHDLGNYQQAQGLRRVSEVILRL